jgi:hypothetical protein
MTQPGVHIRRRLESSALGCYEIDSGSDTPQTYYDARIEVHVGEESWFLIMCAASSTHERWSVSRNRATRSRISA